MNKPLVIGLLCLVFVLLLSLKTKEYFEAPSSKAMVLVEPRKHKDFKRVIDLFDERMPKDWDLYIFCGKSSVDFANEASKGLSRKVYVKPLETDNLTADEYNRMFGTKEFWNQIQAEDILIFQTDAALCKNSTFTIDDFTKYDYIGCAVNSGVYSFDQPFWYEGNSPFYGIGGLSFRKKSFMNECITKYPEKALNMPEDAFFSMCVHDSGKKPPSGKVLSEFCTQYHFDEKSFGAHKTTQLQESDRPAFYEYCPEAKFLSEQT